LPTEEDQGREGLEPDQALQYAIGLQREGQIAEAAEIYRRILALVPDHPDALHFLGVASYVLGDKEKAIQLIGRATEICPDNAAAFNNLGNVLRRQGRLQEAVRAYERSLKLDRKNPNALSNLGTLLKFAGRVDDAISVYRQAIELDPEHVEAHHNLATALLARGEPDEAMAEYKRALSLRPYEGSSYRLIGAAYYVMGRVDEAADIYRRWLTVDPDNAEASHLLTACTGDEPPPRASDDFVRNMFDRFAASFDEVLHRLQYRAPAVVAEAVAQAVGTPAGNLEVLDAGCGTGLGGPLLRPYAKQLTGVDLSARMLEAAAERSSYDELFQGELTAFLEHNRATYDLIASIDTLVYFGDLGPVARALAGALRPGGHVVFTVERAAPTEAPQGYRLNPHGRYSQTAEYVRQALESAGLDVLSISETELRVETNKPVAGLVTVAKASRAQH
jgi:predicted TPR repeat methyltransferase